MSDRLFLTQERYREEYLHSDHWKKVRERLFKKKGQDACCEACKRSGSSLDVHHKNYSRLGKERLKDLVLLCRECHTKVHDYHRLNKKLSLIIVTDRVMQMIRIANTLPDKKSRYERRLKRNLERTTRRRNKKLIKLPQKNCTICLRPIEKKGTTFTTCYRCYMANLRAQHQNNGIGQQA